MRLADERDFADESEAGHAEQMERETKRCNAHKFSLLEKLRAVTQLPEA